jgi:hypothetical protein
VTALARELMAFLIGAGSAAPAPSQARVHTLAEVVGALPALGVRRAILISLQLATELDLASASGVSPGPITLDSVRIERLGTPFEQALLPSDARVDACERSVAHDLGELGALMSELLTHKPVYLEQSLWSADTGPLGRRADREALSALRRALALIAEHCRAGSDRYTNAFDVASDLSKLANIATRIVQRRHTPSIVAVHRPPPRSRTSSKRLPKVVIRAEARQR